jgi:ribonucleoside-triphosphate reductase
MLYLANTKIAKYALENVYTKEIADAHKNADIHIHDLAYLSCYCNGLNLERLIKEGINKIPGKASSAPAKHLSSLMIQMVNLLGCMQMEAAGAQAFNNIDTYLAPFVKVDNLTFNEVKQFMQQLVFNLNIPSRWGSQPVFSNFTFDIRCPKDMENKLAIVGGIEQDFSYGDCQNEMDIINKAFMEVMEEGDSDGQIHTFPIPTYNIDKNFN